MKLKGVFRKNRIFMLGGAFLLLTFLAVALLCQAPSILPDSNVSDPWNSGSEKTDLQPITYNPTPTPQPATPTPTATWNPTGPTTPPTSTPAPTPQPRESIKLWQTLYWTDVNGGHWVNPKEPFSLASILGSNGDQFSTVNLLQNNIYMNIPTSSISPYTVTSWSFRCRETIELQDSNHNYRATIASALSVEKSGSNPALNTNVWVTGSTLSSQQFESIIDSKVPSGTYYFVVRLTDISLTITLSNGDVHVLQPTGSNADNVLYWKIRS